MNEVLRIILLILLIALFVWMLYKFLMNWDKDEDVIDPTLASRPKPTVSTSSIKPAPKQAAQKTTSAAASKPAARPKSTKKDDLTKVEGIGPKINSLLNDAGILSFDDLANASVTKLKNVLEEAGSRFRMHDPSTWSKQAAIAASGDWDKLAKLQDTLNAGRK